MSKLMSYSKLITRLASLYNASALVFFLIPNALSIVGISEPYSSFWRVLPALLASYAAVVLWFSSSDIQKYASFVFCNGIIRILFAILAFSANYQETVGIFIFWLALGDLLVGILCLYLIKTATKKSFIQLLTNR